MACTALQTLTACLCLMTGYAFGSDFNCSTIPPSAVVPCGGSYMNETVCRALGCCFNGSASNIKLRCFTQRGGRCMMYQGQVCQKALNETLTEFTDTPRFFDNAFGQILTEQFLSLVTSVIQAQVDSNPRCNFILRNMLCHYTLPPCFPNKTPMDFCREDCESIFQECSASINMVIGAVKFYVSQKNIDFVHTALPNCSRHAYYKADNSCIHTGFFEFPTPTSPTSPTSIVTSTAASSNNESEEPNLLLIILPAVIGAVVLIALLACLLWCHRRRRRKALFRRNTVTMREKLRSESMKSLDSRLLRLFDPSKMKQFPLDHVNYVRNLGEGHFGKVFQGSTLGFGEQVKSKREVQVAVKALKEGSSKELKDEFYQEVALMSILNHPNIVRLLAVSTEEEPYGMIFEFMCNGDLNQYLRNAKPAEKKHSNSQNAKVVYLSLEDLRYFSVQLAEGMEYLANMKFVHRDLATRNCLVGENHLVKIADFGMSRDLYTSDYYKMSKETLLPIRWLSPEAYLYGKFSVQSDVYAFGVLLWETFTFGLQPYYGYTNREVTELITKEFHLGKPEDCPDPLYRIMKDCWHREPAARQTFTTIVQRLKDPYASYDVPAQHTEDAKEDVTDGDVEGDDSEKLLGHGNYDVPSPTLGGAFGDVPSPTAGEANGDYDVPRSNGDLLEQSNYDVPRSSTADADQLLTDNAEASA